MVLLKDQLDKTAEYWAVKVASKLYAKKLIKKRKYNKAEAIVIKILSELFD